MYFKTHRGFIFCLKFKKGKIIMCYFKGQPVGEMCTVCQCCESYLTLCVPIVVNQGIIAAECDDIDFCNYCPAYFECEELWGKVVL